MSEQEPTPTSGASEPEAAVDMAPAAQSDSTVELVELVEPVETNSADDAAPEPVETRTTVEVGLVRSVRYGPIMIAGGVLCALIAVILALVFPVEEGEMYTVGQVAGFVAVLGGAIGVALGGLLAMLLNLSAKRQQGTAMAVLTDVR